MLSLWKHTGIFAAGLMVLAGCSSGPIDPADIEPVYRIRNSPLPVPDPKWNPRRGRSVATSTAQSTGWQRAPATAVPSPSVGTTVVTVKKGDTLYAISRAYSVPVRSLISTNGLKAPYSLAVGQKLQLPGANVHVVVKGDTSYSISRKYGVTVSALMNANNIKPPYTLFVGQKLSLPGGASSASIAPTPSRGRTIAMPAPPPRSRDGFVWPVEGKLASRFGPREGGIHNDGINILADAGAPVRAAEAGVVVYASNALAGYGNLLLVKHEGGWITAYAHNERILVRKGQKIDKNQVVARVGSTGGVTIPQLHFEIRKGRRALDPLDYLGAVKSR